MGGFIGIWSPINVPIGQKGKYARLVFFFSIDVPYKVVINEGVNLAKTYGPTDAYKFINGVLDKVAIEKRAVEVAANRRA